MMGRDELRDLRDVIDVLRLDNAFGAVFQKLCEVILQVRGEGGRRKNKVNCAAVVNTAIVVSIVITRYACWYLQLAAAEISQNLLPFRRRIGATLVAAEVGLELPAENLQSGRLA